MATAAAPGGGARRPGKAHHSPKHHLSGPQGADMHAGWADGIASLTEGHSAAALLEQEEPAGVSSR